MLAKANKSQLSAQIKKVQRGFNDWRGRRGEIYNGEGTGMEYKRSGALLNLQ